MKTTDHAADFAAAVKDCRYEGDAGPKQSSVVAYVKVYDEGGRWYWNSPSGRKVGPFVTAEKAEADLSSQGYYPRY